MTCVGGMACIVLRHAERADYVDAAWVAAAPRPWDPPLTGRVPALA